MSGLTLDVAEQAVSTRIVESIADGTGFRFAHALIREALYEGILPLRRRIHHQKIGEALAALPDADPDAVAYHFRQAGDVRVASWLVKAGERAQRAYAWGTAAERYEAALVLMGDNVPSVRERAWLLYRLSLVVRFNNRPQSLAYVEEAARLAREANDRVLTAHALFNLGVLHCQMTDFARGITELRAGAVALTEIAPAERGSLDVFDAATNQGSVSFYLAFAGHFAEARALGEQYIADAPIHAATDVESARYADAYAGLGMTYGFLGKPEAAQRAFAHAYELHCAVGHYAMAGIALRCGLQYELLSYRADQIAERERIAREVEETWRRAGETRLRSLTHVAWGDVFVVDGRWDEVREIAMAAASSPGIARHTVMPLSRVALAQGDREMVESLIQEWLPDGPATLPGGTRFDICIVLLRIVTSLALDGGDLATAKTWIEAHDHWLTWSGAVLGQSEGQALWAHYHRASGDPARAYQQAERALAYATEPRQPLALLAAHRLLGELDTDARRFGNAREHLAASLALADACAAPYERALTLLAMAELHAALHERAEAMTLLDEVCATCTPLGAKPALARADTLATRIAVAPGLPAPYPDGLSAREVDVLRLIATGLSNQEIADTLSLSVRTVERHITNLYGKIAARGRADATTYALRHLS